MSDDLQPEVERLRAEVESYRQRELADLRSALAQAREEATHYRTEAHRNAELGRQIAAKYETEIVELRGKLELATRLTSGRQFTRN